MFSIIGIINSYLGYINMNVKIKNQVYTVLGTVGNFYLLYVAYRFFANGFYARGALFILAFLALVYFSYLNVLYYFTKKTSRVDFSPFLEKKLGMKPKEEAVSGKHAAPNPGFVQTNGLFNQEKLMPAVLEMKPLHKRNLKEVVAQLEAQNYLKLDYGGLSEDEIFRETRRTKKHLNALKVPVALPFFELVPRAGELVLFGGLNPIQKKELAIVRKVGLMPVKSALQQYDIFVATAVINGGPFKFAGRTTLMQEEHDFELGVQLVYREKQSPAETQTRRSH
ncbi:DUF6681 family protein [Liquorilactobacillus satsumensis]|uniref:Uncharacterized protein n=1 Tax=Liquorilactobacillus satsumensis DSM 16230 = JCM 12392 TaxID=1423801 RepID=A0A0R1UV36_9LACO|nr:DUF6681 family protein [Liquorilactobacillus satsumensis]KRL97023.1 hypothetical protein FD50_GL001971 [Liquorilactobacillus satsumensis DSM 16230 = JCM 12392]MCC7666192.1 hypothetical protein [Liquorilactobacillus satsumensis]MCP9313482.1 hypothetical protein [Liquorilactobacillus satsumensis]MCP9329127.1 hypothetical protein [Liquorilactobacillus satsumensis]MCP9357459.1 hypothetical protein [Liquorilactobacillus satsumensis]